jgi:Zn-dependent peptidase ImmA (M78 family)/transcriptional regulator with XRE-family HTH domain
MAVTVRVDVRPELLRWARERSRQDAEVLGRRFPRLAEWERGDAQPTLKQLDAFAKAVHAPIGFLFLPAPPPEPVPIPDFRTVADQRIREPSPDLLETIYICQQRQEWYRDYARATGESPVPFVGSAQITTGIEETARAIAAAFAFDVWERARFPTWTEALRRFIQQADALGVLVMVSGIVGNNTHRKLDPGEFRGFALSDDLAPLIFINGSDSKSAQMFTLAHELAHIFLGQTALSNAEALTAPNQQTENWCNRVAAELLVPLATFRAEYDRRADLHLEIVRLARRFKVSTLVILRRMHDAGGLTRERLWQAYRAEVERLAALPEGAGGNFYLTQPVRISRRFARAVIANTLEGQTLNRDAFRLLGVSKDATFRELGRQLEVG